MGAILLFAFALIAVGLGFLQMRNTIYGPFVIRADKTKTVSAFFSDEKTRLQQIDTDRDGLNDYEELNFYGTSPYLPDTDSDGVKDKEEIDRGADPLCKEGVSCLSAESMPSGANTSSISVQSGGSMLDILGQAATESGANTDAQKLLTQESFDAIINNPQALRKMLIESGKFTEKDIKNIDDATLLSIARSALKEISTSTKP